MKIVFKTFIAFLMLFTSVCCKAQLVQTVDDVKKIETNKQQFIKKPLEKLLKEIKPEIKIAYGHPSTYESLGYLRLFFVDTATYNQYASKNKTPVGLVIRLGGNFDWNPATKPKNKKFSWTKEDEKKYGKLTVVDIRVTGAN